MSDHVDGPRSIGDPPADITDLFAFTSPKDPARTVLAMCVFPSAGESAVFSNVIDYTIAVRRVSRRRHRQCREVSACGRGDPLQLPVRGPGPRCAGKVIQRGVCTSAGWARAFANGERREGRVDARGRFPCVRRLAVRPFLPRLGRRQAQEASQSAPARQRALHGRRA